MDDFSQERVDRAVDATVTVTAWDRPAEDPQPDITEWILSRDWPSSVTSVRVLVTWPGNSRFMVVGIIIHRSWGNVAATVVCG